MSGWQALFVMFAMTVSFWLGKITGRLDERADQWTARRDREKMRQSAANYQEKNR